MKAPSRLRLVAIGAAVVLLFILTAVVSFRWGSTGSPQPLPTVSAEPSAVEELSTAEIYRALAPSVVVIEAASRGSQGFDTTGTGVVANANGIVLTALHVVKDAGSVQVTFADGRNTQGVNPTAAAAEAAARRLRVYTIGFGTTEPSPLVCSRDQISGDAGFRPDGSRISGFRGGARRFQQIDEETLTEVAEMTGGEYFQAENAETLSRVLQDLPTTIALERRNTEITVWFALAGAVLILVAVGLSQWWNRSRHFTASPRPAVPG